jgi:hypothetical protein
MKKFCPFCGTEFQTTTSAKFCSESCRLYRKAEGLNPFQRHEILKRVLAKERIPDTDLLWKSDFYIELIADQKCLYCLGDLSPFGFALDRVDNTKPHFCHNATIPACGRCNSTRSDLYSFEQFLLLKPGLEKIRREENKTKK